MRQDLLGNRLHFYLVCKFTFIYSARLLFNPADGSYLLGGKVLMDLYLRWENTYMTSLFLGESGALILDYPCLHLDLLAVFPFPQGFRFTFFWEKHQL